jgi:hypothetical protein
MISKLGGGNPFAAQGAMIDGTIPVPGNLGHLAALEVDQDPAATMAHPTMAFDHGVISVNFHFPWGVGVREFRNDVPPLKLPQQICEEFSNAGRLVLKTR